MEEYEGRTSNKTDLVLKIIVLLIIVVCGCIIGLKQYLKSNNSDKDKVENNVDVVEKDALYKEDLIKIIKEYFYQNKYIDRDNLVSFNINNVNYSGEMSGVEYYKVVGDYSCLDLTSDCLTIPQVGDKIDNNYQYVFYVGLKRDNGSIIVNGLESYLDIGNNNGRILENDKEFIEDIKKIFENYYEENNLINKDNLKLLDIYSVSYIDGGYTGDIYEIKGRYSCNDDSSDCLYLAQVGDPNYGEYYFTLYVLIKDSKIIEIDMMYAEETIDSLFTDVGVKNKIIGMVKNYYTSNGLLNSNNVESWEINKVVLEGYYNDSKDNKIYRLDGSYKCKDNEGDCVYLEQILEKDENGLYPYKVYAYVYNDNGNLVLKNMSGVLIDNDFINIGKVVR